MKKAVVLLFIVIGLLQSNPIHADIAVEVRSGAFFPASDRFRKIYDHTIPFFEIEASTPITCNLDGWANFDWISKNGKSIGFKDHTRVEIANVSLGVKYPYCICECLLGYFGGGISFGRIWLHNRGVCENRRPTRFAVGAVAKVGINYYFCNNLFLDVFADYLYQPVDFHHRTDIGGLKVGAGIGAAF